MVFPSFFWYISKYLIEYWILCAREQKRLSYILSVPRKWEDIGCQATGVCMWGGGGVESVSLGTDPEFGFGGPKPNSSGVLPTSWRRFPTSPPEGPGFTPTPTPEEIDCFPRPRAKGVCRWWGSVCCAERRSGRWTGLRACLPAAPAHLPRARAALTSVCLCPARRASPELPGGLGERAWEGGRTLLVSETASASRSIS